MDKNKESSDHISYEIPLRTIKSLSDEQKFYEYVNSQISKMEKYLKLQNSEGEIQFFTLNEAMLNHLKISMTLNSLYQIAKIEYKKYENEFDLWFAEKYITIREEVNPRSLTSQKWYSTKELEMMVKTRFKEEYKKKSLELTLYERKHRFLLQLKEDWTTHHFALQQLSKNLISELGETISNGD